jgi:hypothetical protein
MELAGVDRTSLSGSVGADEDWQEEQTSLIQSQRYMMEKGLFSDVDVIVGGGSSVRGPEVIPSHTYVLRARSSVFAKMLEERWTSVHPAASSGPDTNEESKLSLDLTKSPLVPPVSFRALLRVSFNGY